MTTLLIMRHAKSSWDNPGTTDHDRPLNDRGRRTAPEMGQLLKNLGLMPDLILCSTALRARETAKLLITSSGYEGPINESNDLYGADAAGYLMIIKKYASGNKRVLLIGHNPSCEDLITRLTGEHEQFPTGALAQIELPVKNWDQLAPESKGKLVHLWRPKELS